MEATAEQDLICLEEWLDGSASPEQVEALRRRIAAEPALADTLDRLKAERETRSRVWSWIEPSQAEGDRCSEAAMRLIREGRPQQRAAVGWMPFLRGAAMAAACATFFIAGWAVRSGGSGADLVIAKPRASSTTGMETPATWSPQQMAARPPVRDNLYHVAVTDEAGNVVAFQPFEQKEQAKRFADDLARWQANRQQAQQGRLLRVADEF